MLSLYAVKCLYGYRHVIFVCVCVVVGFWCCVGLSVDLCGAAGTVGQIISVAHGIYARNILVWL